MCGIAGLLAPDARAAQAMIDTLAHRGPDADGLWCEDGVALAHRRLAIIDLSDAGAQPMVSACGRWVTVYNGELYNHQEVRRELGPLSWRGHSDTETLLAAVTRWGPAEAMTHFAGMFAVALWDRQERRLHLIRDRFGEKPLYYGWIDGRFVFGSELKALLAAGGARPAIDRQAMADMIRLSYVPAPRAIFQGIYKLEAGCHLTLSLDARPPSAPPHAPHDAGGLSIRRYWSLAEVARAGIAAPFAPDEGQARLAAALDTAVRGQTLADVPLGAFLSGGVDSSLIVALLAQAGPVRTFTIGFDDPAYDEAPHARAVAAHLGTDHTEVTVTARDMLEVVPRLATIYNEPFGDSSGIPMHLVSRLARAHVTVALSGDAGDELFGGYTRHITARALLARLARAPAPARRAAALLLANTPRAAWRALERLPLGRRVSLLSNKVDKLAHLLALPADADGLYQAVIDTWRGPSPVIGPAPSPRGLSGGLGSVEHDMMLQDALDYLPDDVLVKVDRAAMAVALETRAPFLDHRVAEVAWRLPLEAKIAGGRGKLPLRALLDRHVPRALIDRPKAGFALPFGDWLKGPLRGWAEDLLAPDAMRAAGYLDAALVQRRWREHLSGRADHATALWNVLMFQQWLAA